MDLLVLKIGRHIVDGFYGNYEFFEIFSWLVS